MTSSTPRDWIATYDPDDPELHAAIRRRTNKSRWVIVPAIVASYIATRTALDASVSTDVAGTMLHAPALLVTAMVLIAVVLVVAGIAVILRPAIRATIRRNPRPVLTRAQSRRVGRQLAGREPVAPHEVPFLRDVALATYAQRWGVRLMAGLMLLATAKALVADNAVDVAIASTLAVLAAAVVAFGLRGVVQARRFLRSVGVAPV